MSGKPEVKRVPSKPVVKPKPVAIKKAPVKKEKKPRPVKPHHKFWTRKGNWKKSPEWLKHCEEEKKEQPKKK